MPIASSAWSAASCASWRVSGETELPSHVVGEMVMKALKSLDDVAYVRYASVYRDFRKTEDFAQFLSDEGLPMTGRGRAGRNDRSP